MHNPNTSSSSAPIIRVSSADALTSSRNNLDHSSICNHGISNLSSPTLLSSSANSSSTATIPMTLTNPLTYANHTQISSFPTSGGGLLISSSKQKSSPSSPHVAHPSTKQNLLSPSYSSSYHSPTTPPSPSHPNTDDESASDQQPNNYIKSQRKKSLFSKRRRSTVKYTNSVILMKNDVSERRITVHGNGFQNTKYLFENEHSVLHCTITLLPTEIIEKIVIYLDVDSIVRVTQVCKMWYKVFQDDEILWEQVCTINYPKETQTLRKLYNRKNTVRRFREIFFETFHNDKLLLKTGIFENKNIKFKKSPWSKEDYLFIHNNNNGSNSHTEESNGSASHGIVNPLMPIKVVVVGDGAVGKTSLLGRFANDEFISDQYLPTIFDNYTTYATVDNKTWAVTIIDTAGSEDYDKIRPLTYTGADIFILCFDLVNSSSFQNVTNIWLKELNTHAPNVPILLCGTKLDLRTTRNEKDSHESLKYFIHSQFSKYGIVTFDEGVELSKKITNCVGYAETSAKSGQGVKSCIKTAISCGCKYSLSQMGKFLSKSSSTSPSSDSGSSSGKRNSKTNCIIQ
ncbi:hypothetical protein C9374_000127 [Naegleria lovaniensis]|uniref:F-box domain-containing protein n=1 Tax=Naegleria lovaniensis TaxID=51637 RepID=A0AA88KNR3_NAELO|nr:uncharacterized protein C9374_000127 [Naegleria lovaniensis]KAG2388688.1 hypothetical protein C9374_000127 [Naegleria lovaniensis]